MSFEWPQRCLSCLRWTFLDLQPFSHPLTHSISMTISFYPQTIQRLTNKKSVTKFTFPWVSLIQFENWLTFSGKIIIWLSLLSWWLELTWLRHIWAKGTSSLVCYNCGTTKPRWLSITRCFHDISVSAFLYFNLFWFNL